MHAEVSVLGTSEIIDQLTSSALKTDTGVDIIFSPYNGKKPGDAVLIGESEANPIESAKKLHLQNRLAPILIVCDSEKASNYKSQILMTPDIGLNTMALPNNDIEQLSSLLIKYVNLGVTRKVHQNRVAAAQSRLNNSAGYNPQSPLLLNELLEHLPLGVMTVSSNYRLLNMNPEAEKMFFVKASQVHGETLDSWLPSRNAKTAISQIKKALKSGNLCTQRLNFKHENQLFHYEMTTCRADHQRPSPGALIIVRDITKEVLADQAQREYQEKLAETNNLLEARVEERTRELNEAKVVLEKSNRRLKRSNEDLEKFSFIIAHDLSEPVRKISIYADLLRKRSAEILDEESLKHLNSIDKECYRVRSHIRSLHDYAKLDSEEKHCSILKLKNIVESVCKELEFLIKDSGTTVLTGDLPEIEADAAQMQILFRNIIVNSITFRRGGMAPLIRIMSQPLDDSEGHRITIEDNSEGFDQKYSEKIFRLFERLQSEKNKNNSGSGLATCHLICERHNGTIRAESRHGEGTKIIIELPARQP